MRRKSCINCHLTNVRNAFIGYTSCQTVFRFDLEWPRRNNGRDIAGSYKSCDWNCNSWIAILMRYSDDMLLSFMTMITMTMMMLMMMMLMIFVAAIHDRYLPDSQLLQRLHHRIHHGNHLYTDVGLVDSDSVLQVANTKCFFTKTLSPLVRRSTIVLH